MAQDESTLYALDVLNERIEELQAEVEQLRRAESARFLPYFGTVLASIDGELTTNNDGTVLASIDLATIDGFPTHIEAATSISMLGNNAFGSIFFNFLDQEGNFLKGYRGGTIAGVSNGESTLFEDTKVYQIPLGSRTVEIGARIINATGDFRCTAQVDIVGFDPTP